MRAFLPTSLVSWFLAYELLYRAFLYHLGSSLQWGRKPPQSEPRARTITGLVHQFGVLPAMLVAAALGSADSWGSFAIFLHESPSELSDMILRQMFIATVAYSSLDFVPGRYITPSLALHHFILYVVSTTMYFSEAQGVMEVGLFVLSLEIGSGSYNLHYLMQDQWSHAFYQVFKTASHCIALWLFFDYAHHFAERRALILCWKVFLPCMICGRSVIQLQEWRKFSHVNKRKNQL